MFKNITTAAVAGLITMSLGAIALYVTVSQAHIGFGGTGKVGPFVVGLFVAGIIAGGIAALKYATSRKSTDKEGFAIGIAVLVVAIVLTIVLVVWAVSGGWEWLQFWYGLLALVLWGAATAVHMIHKHVID